MKSIKIELPRFVKMGETCLRRRGNEYYRDGGLWGVGYKIIEGNLVSWCTIPGLRFLHKQPLFPVSKEEWETSNGIYVPLDYEGKDDEPFVSSFYMI
jgi:hypothetical protein